MATVIWNAGEFDRVSIQWIARIVDLLYYLGVRVESLRDSVNSKKRRQIKMEEGSGNIFADLGLKDAGELYTRAQIGVHVFKILKDKKLKQREIAGILGIAQPDVSHLMNGHFSRFTTDKLLDFLKRLDQKVKIEVSRHHKGEPYQQVTFAS